MKVRDAVVLLDRGQGGSDRLKQQGINLQSVITLPKVLEVLNRHGKISSSVVAEVEQFILDNSFSNGVNVKSQEQPAASKKPRMVGFVFRCRDRKIKSSSGYTLLGCGR